MFFLQTNVCTSERTPHAPFLMLQVAGRGCAELLRRHIPRTRVNSSVIPSLTLHSTSPVTKKAILISKTSATAAPNAALFKRIWYYLHLHRVFVRLPGSQRETPKHFRFQRRIHQLLRDDQLFDLGRGVGARAFEHR
jgi:hypothetical protein